MTILIFNNTEALSYEQFEVKVSMKVKVGAPYWRSLESDLVILDYRVAGENGGEICQQIKSYPKFYDIPVIIFSAYISHNDDVMFCEGDAVINKPFDLVELIEKVNNLIY